MKHHRILAAAWGRAIGRAAELLRPDETATAAFHQKTGRWRRARVINTGSAGRPPTNAKTSQPSSPSLSSRRTSLFYLASWDINSFRCVESPAAARTIALGIILLRAGQGRGKSGPQMLVGVMHGFRSGLVAKLRIDRLRCCQSGERIARRLMHGCFELCNVSGAGPGLRYSRI